eukprot:CAMPEP_0197556742 /NCGR_PEP_ID=MMETSP1320-20131121/15656_1 /TAXON_ID=91990 /ORGANISM="Bolidomonas sp., Strain RCC2347" /LENGTH=58 /DNA_ID=CAMNT_0043117895 /DNA_START=38 /DNA_END=210 /DNA_ORIENTATION=-
MYIPEPMQVREGVQQLPEYVLGLRRREPVAHVHEAREVVGGVGQAEEEVARRQRVRGG